MRIDPSQGSSLFNQVQSHQKNLAGVLEKFATGQRINRASDDAAGMAMAQTMQEFVRGYQAASENINAGISALQIADGGGSAITDMLQRQRDLAVQSSNGTLNSDQRQTLNNEYQSLSAEIDRISQSTDFNGQPLLNGQGPLADGTGKIQTGTNATDNAAIPSQDMQISTLGLSSTQIGSADGANQALSAIDDALKRVTGDRASGGSFQNQLEYARANNDNQTINGTQALSSITDVDYAQALTDKVRESLLADTATSSLTQFNNLSRTHLVALLSG